MNGIKVQAPIDLVNDEGSAAVAVRAEDAYRKALSKEIARDLSACPLLFADLQRPGRVRLATGAHDWTALEFVTSIPAIVGDLLEGQDNGYQDELEAWAAMLDRQANRIRRAAKRLAQENPK